MFHGNRWAGSFVALLGANAPAGLVCLKTLVPPLQAVPRLTGFTDARKLEQILRESVALNSGACAEMPLEYAIRFISLAVEKDQFKHIDAILRRIEELIDAYNGVLTVMVESASPLDGPLAEELKRGIMRQLGASEIKMNTQVVPDLLGGCRLRIGGFYIDSSLKGHIEKMKADLEAELLNDRL